MLFPQIYIPAGLQSVTAELNMSRLEMSNEAPRFPELSEEDLNDLVEKKIQ